MDIISLRLVGGEGARMGCLFSKLTFVIVKTKSIYDIIIKLCNMLFKLLKLFLFSLLRKE